MKPTCLRSLLVRSRVAILCLSMASSLAFAKETRLPLSHVVLKFDSTNWVGKELNLGDAKNKSAVLNNSAEALIVFVMDVSAGKAPNADDPLATRSLASQMARQKYSGFHSFSERNSLPTIASKHLPSGWNCFQSVLKKTPNADHMYSTYCAATDRGFEVYTFLETRQPLTDTGISLFKSLLTDIAPK
jgi:hypothetical protein